MNKLETWIARMKRAGFRMDAITQMSGLSWSTIWKYWKADREVWNRMRKSTEDKIDSAIEATRKYLEDNE